MAKESEEYYIVNDICPRCDGKGKLYEFEHVEAGVCFRCRGNGKYIKPKKFLSKERMEEILGFKRDDNIKSLDDLKKLIRASKR
jgi:Zn-finger nucleic acid-binding protein